jgi:hypothetical protein
MTSAGDETARNQRKRGMINGEKGHSSSASRCLPWRGGGGGCAATRAIRHAGRLRRSCAVSRPPAIGLPPLYGAARLLLAHSVDNWWINFGTIRHNGPLNSPCSLARSKAIFNSFSTFKLSILVKAAASGKSTQFSFSSFHQSV